MIFNPSLPQITLIQGKKKNTTYVRCHSDKDRLIHVHFLSRLLDLIIPLVSLYILNKNHLKWIYAAETRSGTDVSE